MPKPYSQDLRDRVIDAVERGGMSCRAAARRYEISESVAIKWLERYRREGSRAPVGHGGREVDDRTWKVVMNRMTSLWGHRTINAL